MSETKNHLENFGRHGSRIRCSFVFGAPISPELAGESEVAVHTRRRHLGLGSHNHPVEECLIVMWSTRIEKLPHGLLIRVDLESAPAKFSDVLHRWRDDPGSRTFFIELLARAPYDAFRWETPPIKVDSANRPFEFVLLNSPK